MSEVNFEVGQRWSIRNGDWVRDDENGQFPVVEEDNIEDTICVSAQRLVTRKYIGKPWSFRRCDCITVVAELLDDKYGTDYYKQYMKTPGDIYRRHVEEGMASYFDEHEDFFAVDDMQVDDILIYAMPDVNDLSSNHIALYLGDDKVFRQPPFKMSSIDPIDHDMVIKIYRFNHA